MDKLLSYKEVSDLLHISPKQVRYYIARYKLPYVKLGERRRFIREADLEKFLKQNTFRKK